jgi:hypothetical protein
MNPETLQDKVHVITKEVNTNCKLMPNDLFKTALNSEVAYCNGIGSGVLLTGPLQ